jgi:hypothetical protein
VCLFRWFNGGTLSKKRREAEFEKLRDEEVAAVEAIVREAFGLLAEH